MLTFSVAYPSLVTAFTVIASLEVAGRMKGAKGLFNWIGKLPWLDPFFASCALAMLAFTFGGFGGAVNAAYAMNTMVHNTAWIMGHFHVTLGTTVAMTFMGATYWLLPRISGRQLRFKPLALLQPYLWFAGMMLFSVSYHIAGLRGLPRRVYSASLNGEQTQWHGLSLVAAAGAIVLFMSALCYVTVAAATWLAGKKFEATADVGAKAGAKTDARVGEKVGGANVAPAFEFATPLQPAVAGVWDRFGLWTVVAIVIVIAGYAYPIIHLLSQHRYGSPPYQPF
jgi:cytochrome c oxidase subunit 1